MKIRIGITLGDSWFDAKASDQLLEFIDLCESWDVDSIWVSDRIVAPRPTLDPIVFMAYLASRMRNMKFGTSALVLPTRQPVLLAKQLATLDYLFKGRLLLVVGLGGWSLFDLSERRFRFIANELGNVVLRGNADEASTLAEAGAERADVVIAVTGDDPRNLVLLQVAKRRFGARGNLPTGGWSLLALLRKLAPALKRFASTRRRRAEKCPKIIMEF